MKAIDVALMLLALVLLFWFCTGCGPKITVQGETVHRVEGEATVKVVVGVDVSVCEGLEPAAKAECIQSLIELATVVSESKNQEETGFGGMY